MPLLIKYKRFSFSSSPISLGISPPNAVAVTLSTSNFVRFAIADGNPPTIFPFKYKIRSSANSPIVAGRLPIAKGEI